LPGKKEEKNKHTRYKNNYDYAYRKNAEKSTRLSVVVVDVVVVSTTCTDDVVAALRRMRKDVLRPAPAARAPDDVTPRGDDDVTPAAPAA